MKIDKIITISVLTSGLVFGGAYKIPEQSINSMALGAAYIAHTQGADTAYFNPANMAFMNSGQFMEAGITLAHLPASTYDGVQYLPAKSSPIDSSGKSESENLPIPFFHYVSNHFGAWRYGVSLTVPAGLTKRWEAPVQKLFAEQFTLENVELNPVVSYRVNDTFSIAGGLRLIHSSGIVKNDGGNIAPIKRDMEGDTIEFGYNLAMAWRPTSDISVGLTYRSKIDLDEEGDANLYLSDVGQQYGATVSVPLPASLNLGVSKSFGDMTMEVVYERTFWSAYKDLDFNYDRDIQPHLVSSFDDKKDKNWVDTNSYRLGLTYEVSDVLTVMGGYTYDETPVPIKTLSYELPDSEAHIFSTGFRYQQTKSISWGMALLYDYKTNIEVKAGENINGLDGEFTDGGAILTTVGISYEF